MTSYHAPQAALPAPLPSPGSTGAMSPVRIGLLGLGTVGGGTYRVLRRNRDIILARTGRYFDVTHVTVRNLARAQTQLDLGVVLTDDPFAVVNHPDIDVVVETMGGTTLATQLVLQAIANGKHVVTANKAMLAEHGQVIAAAAHAKGVVVAYEGAVAVSIPIIKALREGLSGNRIEWLAGIVNGTSNFILSEMRSKGVAFDQALATAQRLGYAEADPTFDVKGVDAGHKLALLAANAFGQPIAFGDVHIEGIDQLDPVDMALAEQLGYRIKLLGVARRHAHGLALRVHPCLVSAEHPLASVSGSMNGIVVQSDAAGQTWYGGAGAGAEQTASAVIADLVDVARASTLHPCHRVPVFGFQTVTDVGGTVLPTLPIGQMVCRHYLRVDVPSQTKLADELSTYLAAAGLRLQLQTSLAHPENANLQCLVMVTEPMAEADMYQAVAQLKACLQAPLEVTGPVGGNVHILRLEALD